MGASREVEPENGGTLRYRVGKLEEELSRQRERVHKLAGELAAFHLLVQRVGDQVETLNKKVDEDIKEIKHALNRFLFVIVAWVTGLALTVFLYSADKI